MNIFAEPNASPLVGLALTSFGSYNPVYAQCGQEFNKN